jgi:hypothetical protein
MIFDTADLARLEEGGGLVDLVTHEMGHVLGIGTLWPVMGLVAWRGTAAPVYVGPDGVAEHARLARLARLRERADQGQELPPDRLDRTWELSLETILSDAARLDEFREDRMPVGPVRLVWRLPTPWRPAAAGPRTLVTENRA